MNEVINRFVCSFDVSVFKMGIQFESNSVCTGIGTDTTDATDALMINYVD